MTRAALAIAAAALLAGCLPVAVTEPVVPRERRETHVPATQIAAGADRHLIRAGARFGYIDGRGRVAIAPAFDGAGPFSEGLARVRVGDRWGFIRPDGSFAVEPAFIDAADFSAGRARVVLVGAGQDLASRQARREDRLFQTFIDPAGQPIIEPELIDARDFAAVGEQRLAPVLGARVQRLLPLGMELLAFLAPILQARQAWAVIDASGRVLFTHAPAARMLGFSEGKAAFLQRPGWFRARGRWGYVDATGAVTIQPRFDGASSFSEGMAAVTIGERVGFIDPAGRVVIEPRFQQAGPFSEGRARVLVDGRWGYIDRAGSLVIEPRYEVASDFSEGRAAVALDGQYGFIARDGSTAIDFRFDHARPFRHGLAYVRQGSREGYIDAQGRFVWETSP